MVPSGSQQSNSRVPGSGSNESRGGVWGAARISVVHAHLCTDVPARPAWLQERVRGPGATLAHRQCLTACLLTACRCASGRRAAQASTAPCLPRAPGRPTAWGRRRAAATAGRQAGGAGWAAVSDERCTGECCLAGLAPAPSPTTRPPRHPNPLPVHTTNHPTRRRTSGEIPLRRRNSNCSGVYCAEAPPAAGLGAGEAEVARRAGCVAGLGAAAVPCGAAEGRARHSRRLS